MPTIKVNDINIYYEIHGEGEPLVLIVGLGTDISEWQGIIGWLAKKYQVLAFDNRGAGRTDKPDAQYSIEMMANDTAGLMQAVGIEQADVVGVSMGGRIALALALQQPQSVKRLVLVSTSARSVKRRRSPFWMSILSGMPIFRSKYPQPRYAFMRQLQASSAYNGADRLHELQMPTVIMHGKKDKTAPYILAEEMHAGIRGSKMIPFEGSHIFFFMGERQRFLDAVGAFLAV